MARRPADHRLAQVLRRLQSERDDEDAWRELYNCAWPFVYPAVYRMTGGRVVLSREVSHEVFVRLYRYCSFSSLTDPAAFRAYTKRVAKNTALDAMRRELARPEVSLEGVRVGSDSETGPSEFAEGEILEERILLSDLLAHEIGSLSREERELAKLLMTGSTTDEIAKHFGLSYNAAATRTHRLRGRLRETALGKYLRKHR